MGLFDKLKAGLTKTRDALTKNLDNLVFGKRVLEQALFEELEEKIISAGRSRLCSYRWYGSIS